MNIIGVDPGFTGALCLFSVVDDDPAIHFEDMPLMSSKSGKNLLNIPRLAAIIRGFLQRGPACAYIEQVGSMPKQGVSSTFRFGESYGAVQGVLGALGVPTYYITPQCWKKPLGLIGAEKDFARTLAIHAYPSCSDALARKLDIGRADALLIAAHGYRVQTGLGVP